MDQPALRSRLISFGDFVVDPNSGEVRKHGVRIRLQEKPFQVLIRLATKPGQVISREELCAELWPDGTFVDYENGLNAAMNKLRAALADDPEAPRYIETLPRRGYRFVGEVRTSQAQYSVGSPSTNSGALAAKTQPDVAAARRRAQTRTAAIASVLLAPILLLSLFRIGRSLGSRAQPSIRSIAVLPLENLSPDPDQEYFAQGMTDALITDLARVSSLRVVSRTTALTYKQSKKTLPEVAKELNVEAIVEGTVTRFGSRVRITAQLIRATDDRHLWADSYETEMTDVLLLQSKLAADIAREVNATLAPSHQAALAKPRPVQQAAYEAYLRGRFFWNTFTPKGIENAIQYFQQSIGLDPKYAPAYVGLADSYVYLNVRGFKPGKDVMPKAREAVEKALALDNTLGEAHITLANIKFVYDWDWAGADQEFRRGFALAPNYAVGHLWHSNYLTLLGQREEGLEELRKAAESEPLSLIVNANLCRAYFWADRLNEAIAQCNKTIELDPRFDPPSEWLQMIYERKGMDRECAAEMERLLRANGDQETAAKVRRIFVTSGLVGLKRWDALNTLDSEENGEFVSPMSLAGAYDDLGHREKAMQLVEKAYDDRDFGLLFNELDSHEPDRASLRSDPRYISILRKMNLPPTRMVKKLE